MILIREQQQQHQHQTVSGGVEKVLLDCVSIEFIIECLKEKVTWCMPSGSFCFRFLQTPKLENWKHLCNVVARHSPVK